MKHFHLDNRRRLILPGNAEQTVAYAVKDWVETAKRAIAHHGFFAVALSGGSTPKKIFQALAKNHVRSLDWSKVWLFWSDERQVLPSDPESNFRMAMIEGELTSLPLHADHIHRMVAEKDLEANAYAYERLIEQKLKGGPFDLIMLGMGEDGHTASLFPHTEGLQEKQRLVIPNYITEKQTWRMTFTFTLINQATHICLYVIGASKAAPLEQVLFSPLDIETYPSQQIGTEAHPATWIIDEAASSQILAHMKE